MNQGEVLKEIDANYTQSEGRAVGGTLTITQDHIRFEPNKLDELTGGDELRIPVENIASVGVEKKFSNGLKDTLTGGGLRDRLRIQRKDNREELFVVSGVSELADEIRTVVEGDAANISDTETGEAPELGGLLLKGVAYILGGIAILLGISYLLSSDIAAGVLLLLSGVIGFPFTRTKIAGVMGIRINKWTATILFTILWVWASYLLR